jgi:hypothetical protein
MVASVPSIIVHDLHLCPCVILNLVHGDKEGEEFRDKTRSVQITSEFQIFPPQKCIFHGSALIFDADFRVSRLCGINCRPVINLGDSESEGRGDRNSATPVFTSSTNVTVEVFKS